MSNNCNDMQQEIWKDIIGYEGVYQISNFGNVKSFARKGAWKERILKACVYKGKDYLYVLLNSIFKKPKKFKIHRLVCTAFVPNPANLPEVNHIDGNKQNNNIDNLEWCSRRDNALHYCYSLGKTVIPIKMIFDNGVMYEFKSIRLAGRILNLDSSMISAVLNNTTKKHHGFTAEKTYK